MKQRLLILGVTVLGLTGCAHSMARPSTLGEVPQSRAVELPLPPPSDGPPRDAKVLVDVPALRLASIVLRKGTVLPPHSSPVVVTIVSLQGAGAVVVGEQRLRLDPAHAVVLGPNVSHAVEPDGASDLVVLVHHLGSAEEHHP